MRKELESAALAARNLPQEELPRLLGDLEELKAIALARLTVSPVPQPPDNLLDVDAAAQRLGVSRDYLYHNHKRLPFTKRVGRKLKFSAQGIERFCRR